MATVSDRYKLIFINNPMCGSSAIDTMMQNEMAGRFVPSQTIKTKTGEIDFKHSTISQLREYSLLPKTKIDQYFKFTSIRNPFDIIVTNYIKNKNFDYELVKSWVTARTTDDEVKDKRLESLLTLRNSSSLSEYIVNNPDYFHTGIVYPLIKGVDKILKFETLQRDLNVMFRELNIEGNFFIPLHNKTSNRKPNYRKYYTEKARKIAEVKIAREIKENKGHEYREYTF